MKTPLIGITTYGLDNNGLYGIDKYYVDAVRRAGGIPLLIPPGEAHIDALMTQLDGLILSGGGDVDPLYYNGAVEHPEVYGIDTERDAMEIPMARRVVEEEMPTLAICRGAQVMNVALGGTLVEHLPDEVGEAITHRQGNAQWAFHPVEAAVGSRLAEIMGKPTTPPASWHHQAIRTPAPILRVVATAADGSIEAAEHPAHPLLLAVQWHPEITAGHDPAQQRLFDALVEAARQRSAHS